MISFAGFLTILFSLKCCSHKQHPQDSKSMRFLIFCIVHTINQALATHLDFRRVLALLVQRAMIFLDYKQLRI